MYNLKWVRFTIKTNSEAVEAITYVLSQIGIQGAEIEDPSDITTVMEKKEKTKEIEGVGWDYIDKKLLNNKDKDEVVIKAYLPEDARYEEKYIEIQEKINNIKRFLNIGRGTVQFEIINEEEWANSWKRYYKPFRVGKNIIIKPSWEPYELIRNNDIIIEMDPGMAFGTGTHETTSMCIELIEQYVNIDNSVLDIGCGSGILSIASAKLGAKNVIAVDLDCNAVKVAKENVIINNVQDKVQVYKGNLLESISEKADIVVSNIIADVIINLSQNITEYLNSKGIFIVSGIIKERLTDVKTAIANNGFVILKINNNKEWCAIAAKKRK